MVTPGNEAARGRVLRSLLRARPLSDSLLVRTARGATWTIGWRLATRLLGFANTLVLARLLVPGDFGLVALATGFFQGVMAVSALGVDEAVIRQRNTTRETYDTAFTINLIRGLATCGIVAACAVPMAAFFRDDRLTPVMLTIALIFFAVSFENIGTIEFWRDFAFEKEFKLLILPRCAAVLVTIAVAWLTRSHWALVAGIATRQLLNTAMGYVMHPYRPRLSLAAWRDLASFSLWSWAISMAGMVRERIDAFMIGRLLGAGEVGVWSVGQEFAVLPTQELAAPLARACFSNFAAASRAGEDPASDYLRIMAAASLIVLPAGVGISLVAGPAVVIAFGPRWLEAITVMRVLGAAGALQLLGAVTGTLLSAHGILRPSFRINILSMLVKTVAAGLLIVPFGLLGAALAHAITLCVENLAFLNAATRHFGVHPLDLLKRLWRGLLATAAMAGVLLLTGLGSDVTAPVSALAWAGLVGGLVYGGVLLGTWWAMGRPDGPETDLLTVVTRFRRAG